MEDKLFKKYSLIFIIFMIGSFLGFIHENLLTLLKGNIILRQGLIYEPLIPIYGIGSIIFYLVLSRFDLKNKRNIKVIIEVFIITFIMGGVIEYICSLAQEKIFGTISWDYSKLKFDINGRTSLLHSIFWGIVGVLFYEFLLPLIYKLKKYLFKIYVKGLIIILSILLVFDCSISILACYRQRQRLNNISPSNYFSSFLDQKYPDEYLNRIYSNAKRK